MFNRSIRRLAFLGMACALLGFVMTACGSSGPSQAEIVQAEKRGRQYRAEKEKERKLEREIGQLKRERRLEKKHRRERRADDAATAPQLAPTTSSAPRSARASCGGSLEVGPDTTCEFAANVRSEYEYEIGSGPGTIYAYSPALNETFAMSCTGAPHECSGAISATVYFP
jgi:hypothetical protein